MVKRKLVVTDKGNYEVDATLSRWLDNRSLADLKWMYSISDAGMQRIYDVVVKDYLSIN